VVALLVALRRPELVRKLVFIAGVFHLEGWLPEAIDPDLEPPDFLAASYAEISPDGPEHYPVVVEKLARMHLEGPMLEASDLGRIESRTLVMVADDDEVRLEHAVELYRGLADAELAVVPGTSHGLLLEKPALCNRLILDFLTSDPVPTDNGADPARARALATPLMIGREWRVAGRASVLRESGHTPAWDELRQPRSRVS
jgi:pimeloyl-ACP methyl ester carboxylesterase